MIWEDSQLEIDKKYEEHLRRSGLCEDERFGWDDEVGEDKSENGISSIRWDSYNEDYVSEFDWELYGYLID
ncbi:hypothetical protein CIL05_06930 [Virgibacillus profundi]|uniref:Uncharacterized protein n=1 Tax=Virgibacillus profundi TaxID=2024555 RepID=A0A2A2IG26_9BACI|nr:hypothetical protein [Virgibacillus profundi]PAV30194.1 hypothetical protein CIL05_06930 [Virgibacillus profundi]PXY54366.1 hypothetical protein CIT14_07015 [Virgibacillus profundi]